MSVSRSPWPARARRSRPDPSSASVCRRQRRGPARRQRHAHRRPPDRRHRRRRHRRDRALPLRSALARNLRPQVRAPGLQDAWSVRTCSINAASSPPSRAARSRRPHRDDHGDRRVADRRRPLERAADGDEPGDPRGRADRPRPVVAGQDHPRRAGQHLRRRRHPVDPAELAVVARLQHQRRQLQHRRRHGELARRRRRRDDALLRPGDVRGGQLHDLGDPGGSAGRRRLHQHGDQGRRQPVAR